MGSLAESTPFLLWASASARRCAYSGFCTALRTKLGAGSQGARIRVLMRSRRSGGYQRARGYCDAEGSTVLKYLGLVVQSWGRHLRTRSSSPVSATTTDMLLSASSWLIVVLVAGAAMSGDVSDLKRGGSGLRGDGRGCTKETGRTAVARL